MDFFKKIPIIRLKLRLMGYNIEIMKHIIIVSHNYKVQRLHGG